MEKVKKVSEESDQFTDRFFWNPEFGQSLRNVSIDKIREKIGEAGAKEYIREKDARKTIGARTY